VIALVVIAGVLAAVQRAAHARFEVAGAAYATSPITNASQGKADKIVPGNGALYVLLKFSGKLRGNLREQQMTARLSFEIDGRLYSNAPMNVRYTIPDPDLDKAEILIPLFPPEYDLTIPWQRNLFWGVARGAGKKIKVPATLVIEFSPVERRNAGEARDQITLDFSSGEVPKAKGNAFSMPKAEMKDAKLEKQILALFRENIKTDWSVDRVIIVNSDWTYNRHPVSGVIIDRHIYVADLSRNKSANECFVETLKVAQVHQGGNKYGPVQRRPSHEETQVLCSVYEDWLKRP
jgi:hypothetical protein